MVFSEYFDFHTYIHVCMYVCMHTDLTYIYIYICIHSYIESYSERLFYSQAPHIYPSSSKSTIQVVLTKAFM